MPLTNSGFIFDTLLNCTALIKDRLSILDFTVIRYEEIDSTNSEAWRLIDRYRSDRSNSLKISSNQSCNQEGSNDNSLSNNSFSNTSLSNTVIVAKSQTHGRGQRGNSWRSPLGGLFMSVILQPNLAIAAMNAHQITLWTAWGIAKALNETGANVKLKWLNDLIIDRRKLGGILTETRILDSKINYAVVGIGINWVNEVPDGAIAIGELPTTLSSMDDLMEVVLSGVRLGQSQSDREGMQDILAEYLEMLSDRHIHKIIDGRELHGQIIDIRSTGELVVRWVGNLQNEVYQPQNFSVGY